MITFGMVYNAGKATFDQRYMDINTGQILRLSGIGHSDGNGREFMFKRSNGEHAFTLSQRIPRYNGQDMLTKVDNLVLVG